MTQLVLSWKNKPWGLELHPGLNTLGRNPTNDFRVSDVSVSGFHCELSVGDAEVTVRDLQSTNGTFVDDVRVEEAPIRVGQSLKLGTVEFRLEEALVVKPHPSAAQAASDPKPAQPGAGYSCARHPSTIAAHHCRACRKYFCEDCVRHTSLGSGQTMAFCTECDSQCEPVSPPGQATPVSLLGRLTQTMKIHFKF